MFKKKIIPMDLNPIDHGELIGTCKIESMNKCTYHNITSCTCKIQLYFYSWWFLSRFVYIFFSICSLLCFKLWISKSM